MDTATYSKWVTTLIALAVVGCSGPDQPTEGDAVQFASDTGDAGEPTDVEGSDDGGKTPHVTDAGGDSQDAGQQTPGEVVQTDLGKVRGAQKGGVWAYKGIPYAKPPVDERRWRAPEAHDGWEGTLDGREYGPACPQTGVWGERPPPCSSCGEDDAECRKFCQSEDCLNLNVWTPADATDDALPVMVWFHGGSFVSGAGSLYNGARLAEHGDVVVVTVNYRLGALGAMAHSALDGESCEGCGSANYGLWDQIASLRWVREHIDAFGGDPEQVTIFGESAGGSSVCQLVTSGAAEGLFEGAVMQSGICQSVMRPKRASRQQCPGTGNQCPSLQTVRDNNLWDCIAMECVGELLADELGCSSSEDTLGCLRQKEASEVLEALPESRGFGEPGMVYSRFLDGTTLRQPPGIQLFQGNFERMPFVMGTTADEMTLFYAPDGPSIDSVEDYQSRLDEWGACSDELEEVYPAESAAEAREAFLELSADQWYTCATNLSAKWVAGHGVSTHLYRFTRVPLYGRKDLNGEGYRLGAYHGAELAYLFGNFPTPMTDPSCEAEGDGSWRCCDGEGRCYVPEDLRLSRTMMDYWASFARDGVPDPADAPDWPAFQPGQKYLAIEEPPTAKAGLKQNKCRVWEGVWAHIYQGTGYCN